MEDDILKLSETKLIERLDIFKKEVINTYEDYLVENPRDGKHYNPLDNVDVVNMILIDYLEKTKDNDSVKNQARRLLEYYRLIIEYLEDIYKIRVHLCLV